MTDTELAALWERDPDLASAVMRARENEERTAPPRAIPACPQGVDGVAWERLVRCVETERPVNYEVARGVVVALLGRVAELEAAADREEVTS